ncbi:MAG: hypothetical protein LBS69_05145 [Prevotellaceae bacterium]|jgi:hypothetical protein|nr:hypothetical protein [Prevotellaceae bacterium]
MACIVFSDTAGGTYSNGKGYFYIPVNIKQIEISSIGYNTKKMTLNKKIDTIFLSPKIYEISETKVIPAKKKRKSVELGYAEENSDFGMSYLSGDELAVYISCDNIENSYRKIKQFIFKGEKYLVKKLNLDKRDFISVFKINFYRAIENKEIGDLINTEDIVFTSEVLKSKTKLDVSKYNIYMPENGIFVAVEWIGKINTETTQIIKASINDRLEPNIRMSWKIPNTIVYEKRRFVNSNTWQRVDKNNRMVKDIKSLDKSLDESSYYTPLISIVLE